MTGQIIARWLILIALFLAACDDGPTRAAKGRLVGTWVSEKAERSGQLRRVLALEADGKVKNSSFVLTGAVGLPVDMREGEWFLAGVNFKRKYTRIDGKPLTNAFFVYETHELISVSATELVGFSSVGQGEIRFRKAPPGRD